VFADDEEAAERDAGGQFLGPPNAQFIRIPGTNRYRVKSLHGGLDD
jgi:hypothetical protein